MTPLHQASLRSFKRWHPGWDVSVVWGDDGDDARRRSDVWRWGELARVGGVWFDSDVIWYGSIEPHLEDVTDAALTTDGGTPGPDGKAFSIGVCAGVPGSRVFAELHDQATERLSSDGDQTTGTSLIADLWGEAIDPADVVGLPFDLFYRVPPRHRDMERLWLRRSPIPISGIAMHWYGSRRSCDPDPESPIGRALRRALG